MADIAGTKATQFAAREKRVRDAIELKVSDRIPIIVRYGFFPVRYAGITMQEFMYDPEKLWDATVESNWRLPVRYDTKTLLPPGSLAPSSIRSTPSKSNGRVVI